MSITRRDLLKAALAAPLWACARPPHRGSLARLPAGKRVVVVGGGLSGLTAAYRLMGAGHDVTVLEAQPRAGGRIVTLREPFTGGAYVEAGAKHVVNEPGLTALIRELGVALGPPPGRGPRLPQVEVRGGVRRMADPDAIDPDEAALTPEEAALEFGPRLARYFGPAMSGDPRSAAWLTAELARHDQTDVESYLRAAGASEAFIRFVRGTVAMGEPTGQQSALWVMQQSAMIQREIGWSNGLGRVVGGTDRLPAALAARLGDRLLLGAVVRRVKQTAAGLRLFFERRGALHELSADHVIVTAHAPVVRAIAFEPGLPAPVLRALDAVRTSSVVRAWVQLDRPLWSEAGVAAGAESDDLLGGLHQEAAGPAPILSVYQSGDAARSFAALPAQDRRDHFLTLAEKAHPGARQHVIADAMKVWDEDPYARGAYAWLPPRFMTELLPELLRPSLSGRLHFAGDYTSFRPGFMHGAVASAERVVAELLRVS